MNLRTLTDESLLQQTKNLVTREREIAIEILHHLKEVERRRLFLDRGYSTLWAYMTQELRYSESAAQRRIEALRALKEIPELEAKIASGALSLSNVAKLQSTARRAEKTAQDDGAKKVFAQHQIQMDNSVTLKRNIKEPISQDEKKLVISQTEKKMAIFQELENKTQKEAEQIVAKHYPQVTQPKDRSRAVNATQTEVRITVSHEVMKKIEHVKNLLSHKNPNPSLGDLLELMADFVIAKKDLSRDKERPKDSLQKIVDSSIAKSATKPADKSSVQNPHLLPQRQWPEQSKPTPSSIPSDVALQKNQTPRLQSKPHQSLGKKRKYIPMPVRRQVWQKAKGCCEYQDEQTQKRCQTTHQLEIEHVRPVAFGGGDEIQNLQLLCRAHNHHNARAATLM